MELLATIAALLNIIELGFKIHERVAPTKERIAALSETLQSISTLINEVADDLQIGIYPHGRCAQLEQYLHNLDRIFTEGKLRDSEQEKFRTLLTDAVRIEALLVQLNGLSETQKTFNLNMLRSISGSYAALSQIVKH